MKGRGMTFSPRSWTTEERNRLWDACDSIKLQMAEICRYYFCLRPNEVLQLHINNFRKEGCLIIPNQKNKVMNEQYPIPPELKIKLYAYLTLFANKIKANGGWLFWSNKRPGKPMTLSGYCAMFRKARVKAGLDGDEYVYFIDSLGRKHRRISPHTAKAERIREVYRATGSERKAQALAHHKSRISTLRYLGNPMEDLTLKEESILEVAEKAFKKVPVWHE